MTDNVRIVFPNDADGATLSCSPDEVVTLPVTNLQVQTRGDVWRSNSVISAQHILGDFSGYKSISMIALVRHNMTEAGTYRLRLYSEAEQTGTLLYDSGTTTLGGTLLGWGVFRWGIDPWGSATLVDWPVPYFAAWFDAVTALSFDLELSDTSNPDGFLQAARLVLGGYIEPAVNVSWGLGISWQEQSKQIRTEGGTLRTDERQEYRRINMDLRKLSDAERGTLLDRFRRIGLRNDLFLSCFPNDATSLERDFAGMVKLVQVPTMTINQPSNHQTAMVFEES
jgi:hypothetical protein